MVLMKLPFLMIAALFLGAGYSAAKTVDELKVSYEVRLLAIDKEHREGVQKLVQGYLGALGRTRETLQKSGRLDDVLEVVVEEKNVRKSSWPLPVLGSKVPKALVAVRKKYENARESIEKRRAEALLEVADKMTRLLESSVVELTKAGKLADAKEARDLIAALKNDGKILNARKLLDQIRLGEEAPVALRLRRSGDGIEVLVRYNRWGKIAMDSPVENVVEITGEKKERGKTKAKVLGEFVGAEGYQAETIVAYESDQKKITPPLRAISLGLKPNTEAGGKKGLEIRMGPKAINPRVEWPEVLAPVSSSGGYLLEFEYFIPSSNKKVTSFSFHHSTFGRLAGEAFDKKGQWTKSSIRFQSTKESEMMRLFIEGLNGSNRIFDGGNEAVYLGEMKLTTVAFAGHLVENFKGGKRDGEPVVDPAKQKAIILAGEFSPAFQKK